MFFLVLHNTVNTSRFMEVMRFVARPSAVVRVLGRNPSAFERFRAFLAATARVIVFRLFGTSCGRSEVLWRSVLNRIFVDVFRNKLSVNRHIGRQRRIEERIRGERLLPRSLVPEPAVENIAVLRGVFGHFYHFVARGGNSCIIYTVHLKSELQRNLSASRERKREHDCENHAEQYRNFLFHNLFLLLFLPCEKRVGVFTLTAGYAPRFFGAKAPIF